MAFCFLMIRKHYIDKIKTFFKSKPTYAENYEGIKFGSRSVSLFGNNNQLVIVYDDVEFANLKAKEIQQFINNLGTSDNSTQGYVTTQQGQIINGIATLTSAIQEASQQGIKFDGTTQDLYQYKILNKSQKEQADAALSYIYRMLPENAKTLLKVRTPNGTSEDAQKLIATIIASQIDVTNHYDIELKAGKTAQSIGKSSNAGTKDSTEQETSLIHNVMQSIGGTDTQLKVDRGDGIQMIVNGSTYNRVTKPNGDSIGDTSLSNMLDLSGLGSIIKDTHLITFGDQKITPEQMRNITYNNTGIVRANLPINSDGTVNLKLLEQYQQAENEINALGENATQEQISNIFEKHDLKSLLTPNGKPDITKFGAFIVTEAYTTKSNGIKDTDFVKKIDDPTDAQIELIKESLAIGTGKDRKKPDIDTFDWWNPFDYFSVDDIYKAAIYIPITNNQLAAVTGANQHIDYDEALQLEDKYQRFEKRINKQSTDASALGL